MVSWLELSYTSSILGEEIKLVRDVEWGLPHMYI